MNLPQANDVVNCRPAVINAVEAEASKAQSRESQRVILESALYLGQALHCVGAHLPLCPQLGQQRQEEKAVRTRTLFNAPVLTLHSFALHYSSLFSFFSFFLSH